MANVVYSPGIDHVSGALAKPSKNSQHSCTKMLLATHRIAATTSSNCNRLYLRTPVKRITPLSPVEQAIRNKFSAVASATSTRLKDLSQQASDQAAFKAQTRYKTLRQYVWAAEAAKWEQNNG